MSRGGGGRPQPGRPYVVRRDDEDEVTIATEAYGDPGKGPIIWGANPGKISKGGKAKRGDTFIIPGTPPPLRISGKADDDLTVMVESVEIPVVSAQVISTMDTGADGFAAQMAWTPGANAELDRVTRPYGYERAAAYIGNDLIVAGYLYTVEPEMTARGIVQTLHGFSFTADAIDSHVPPPYERNNITLEQLAIELGAPLGLKAVFDVKPGAAFARVTADRTESIFEHLAKLAAQRGILVSCTPEGNFLFWRARTDGPSIGTIEEGGQLAVGWKAVYDGRKRWYAYKCLTAGAKHGAVPVAQWGQPTPTKGSKAKPPTATVYDKHVPRSRFMAFSADDTVPGAVVDAANWRKNKQFVESLAIPFEVQGWRGPDGKVWRVNTKVTVKSAVLRVPDGFTFIIRAVEFNLGAEGRTATLSLVPPEAYTGRDIGEIWK